MYRSVRGARRLIWPAAMVGATTATALAGSLSGDFESRWYRRLRKPSWQPPGAAIGAVWTVLYLLTAASGVAVGPRLRGRRLGVVTGLLGLQYLLNAFYTPLLTRRRNIRLATIDSAALCATVTGLVLATWRVRRLSATLLVPYVLWTAFATLLSGRLATLNPRDGGRWRARGR